MFSYKCIVAYEGTRYNGWQKQGNTPNTIQGKIEEILSKMLEEPIEIAGSGRTDAGVHALGQVFHFHCNKKVYKTEVADTDSKTNPFQNDNTYITPENDANLFLETLNGYLPKDIRILSIEPCAERFHARLNAIRKTYCYQIDTSAYGNLFLRNTAHHIAAPLDVDAMKRGASYLPGTHDFRSFCSNKRMKKSSVRTIYNIDITEDSTNQLLRMTFTGNGFLYNMVRILSGTLIEIGLGLRDPEEVLSILEGCNRGLAGHTAPAKGLFLVSVAYPEDGEAHPKRN